MKRAALFLATGLLVLVSPASGQLAPGYSGQSGIRRLPSGDTWFAIRQLGLCLAQRKRAQSLTLLDAPYGSPAQAAAVQALIGRETSCLRFANRLYFTHDMLRGGIAEALYERDFDAPPPADPAAPRPEIPLGANGRVDGRALLLRFAHCYVARRPAEVHELLTRSRLGDDDEFAIMNRLASGFEPCVPADMTIQFDVQTTRMLFAEALYERARAAGGGR